MKRAWPISKPTWKQKTNNKRICATAKCDDAAINTLKFLEKMACPDNLGSPHGLAICPDSRVIMNLREDNKTSLEVWVATHHGALSF